MLVVYTLYGALALTTALAFKFGGRAERAGMAWLLINTIIGLVNELSGLRSPMAHLVVDGIFALGLLPFAIYFVSWWVGVHTLLAAGAFLIQAVYLLSERPSDPFFGNVLNALFGAQLLNLSVASLGSAWARGRGAKKSRLRQPLPTSSALVIAEAD